MINRFFNISKVLFLIGFSISICKAQTSPSINSLNEQMDQLEKLLGIPSSSPATQTPEKDPVLFSSPVVSSPEVSTFPESLQGIEKKLIELESMVSDLPEDEIVQSVAQDPWDLADANLSFPVSELPHIKVSRGMVVRYVPASNAFLPVQEGEVVKVQTLFLVPSSSELVVSFVGKAAVRFSENSRAVLGPPQNNQQVVDLRNGTVSAYLNPERDFKTSPSFAIRTRSGLIEAKGTFYAVTEYKGQAYTSVKKGKITKTPTAPSKPDFSAYIRKSKVAKTTLAEEKSKNN